MMIVSVEPWNASPSMATASCLGSPGHRPLRLEGEPSDYDMSTIELYGDYQNYDEAGVSDPHRPRPAYGHTKSGRKHLKQIQFGINVVKDGAVPISHRVFDGNAPEAPTHLENLKDLARLLPKGDLLYLGDSKLDSQENLLAIVAGQGKFVGGGTFSEAMQNLYLSVRMAGWKHWTIIRKARPTFHPRNETSIKA